MIKTGAEMANYKTTKNNIIEFVFPQELCG